METVLIAFIAALAVLLLLALAAVLLLIFRRPPAGGPDSTAALGTLTQTVQSGQTQIATLAEKVAGLEPAVRGVTAVQVELKGLAEKVAQVEQNQSQANQGLNTLAKGLVQTTADLTAKVSDSGKESVNSVYQVGTGLAGELGKFQKDSGAALAELRALTAGLNETAGAIRAELTRAKNDLTELQSAARARQELETQMADSVRRLETIIAGTQTKGSAGENILERVFAQLPAEWQVRNFQVAGKPVEFGLRLPNHLILPIDSKWAATNLLEQFVASQDLDEQQRLKGGIEDAVLKKAREVRKYIDPSVTVAFGVAVLPDAVYDLCARIQSEAFQMNVVLVSYSMFIPYLLLVFQTMLKTSQSVDLQKLDAHLRTIQDNVTTLQDELDGRFSRAITMLSNSRDEMRAHLGKVNGSLASLQMGAAAAEDAAALPGG